MKYPNPHPETKQMKKAKRVKKPIEHSHISYGDGPVLPIALVQRMGKKVFDIVQPPIALVDLLERAAYECIAAGMELMKNQSIPRLPSQTFDKK